LNIEPYSSGNIILANDNFGCGSSREHAVWALKDYGIEAVISTSFADIFYRNSFKNGLLLISLKKDELENIFGEISASPKYNLTINIQNQTITTPNSQVYSFVISDSDKERIIFEYDDIELSLKHEDKIRNYESEMKLKKPWIFENNND
jgi:3-isopropylmalate/(R)-2-methylmalate dehydratase small subunit